MLGFFLFALTPTVVIGLIGFFLIWTVRHGDQEKNKDPKE